MASEVEAQQVPYVKSDEGDIAEIDPQDKDTFQATAAPRLVDYETKHRIARAFQQLATHFDTTFKDKEKYTNFPKDLSKRVGTLLLKEDYQEAHRILCDMAENAGDEVFEKQYSELLTDIVQIMTTPKGAAALHAALRDGKPHATHPTLPRAGTEDSQRDHKSVSEASGNPESPNLKVWKHRLSITTTASSPHAHTSGDTIVKSNVLTVQNTLSPLTVSPRSPLSPGHSLWFTKTLGISDSGDPFLADQSGTPPADDLIYWKLFKRISQAGGKLSHDVHLSLAQRLSDLRDVDKAITAILACSSSQWHIETYKLLIFLYLNKKPKDVDAAQKILSQYASSTITVNVKRSNGSITTETRNPTTAERHILWFYFMSLVKEAKWSDCAERYEEAKVNSEGHAYLDNAIMAVSLTYHQYEYGWKVYEGMKEMDRHSPAIVMSLCWKAFFAKHPDTNEPIHTKDQLLTWEARAWAIYGRLQQSSELIQRGSLRYVRNRLRDIVSHSPATESREAKLSQLRE